MSTQTFQSNFVDSYHNNVVHARASRLMDYYVETYNDANLAPASERLVEVYREKGDDFVGLSHVEFLNHMQSPDMTVFNKIKGSLKLDKVAADFTVLKRKRCQSEIDGEFNFDRKWDLAPFDSTKKLPMPVKSVVVNCCFAAHSGIDFDQITAWGALCYGLIKILEDNGFSCEVNIIKENRNSGGNGHLTSIYKVKSCGEYISEQNLAKYFHGSFYRRCLLLGISLNGLLHEAPVGWKLGHPVTQKTSFVNGLITLGSEMRQEDINLDNLKKVINL